MVNIIKRTFSCVILILGAMPSAAFSELVPSNDIRVVDGDTLYHGSEKYRLVGFDTPETYRPECAFERALGEAATSRLIELIESAAPLDLIVLPGRDKYGRGLARLLVGTTDVKDTLIAEGLARPYTGGRRSSWCRGAFFQHERCRASDTPAAGAGLACIGNGLRTPNFERLSKLPAY